MKFDVLNRYTGAVKFTAEIDCEDDAPRSLKLRLAVLWAVKNNVSLAGANLTGANLAGVYLAGVNLAGVYLAGANLTGANLTGANLTGANLAGANLAGVYLAGVNLAGVNLVGVYLAGANLTGASLIDGGQDARGYRFWAWRRDDGAVIVRGGCREWAGFEAARAHYGADYASDGDRAECIARIALIETVAQANWWVS